MRISEDLKTPNTGPYVSNCNFGLKTVAPAYGFDIGTVVDSMSAMLGPFLGFPAVPFGRPVSVESGSCECPFEIHVDNVSVDIGHAVTSRTEPVNNLGWGRSRWLKRRDMAVVSARLGPPSLVRTSRNVGCGDAQVGNFRSCVSDVDAGVVVDGECDGHQWCHACIIIGHSTRRRLSGSVTTCPGVSRRLSSRPSCPPPVRPAPGVSSRPSLSRPLPSAHSALGCDDVGDRILAFDAGASVARPFSFVPSASACASDSSLGSLHPAGSCQLSSRSVVPIRHSVKFSRSKCGNVLAQRCRRLAAASVGGPGLVSIQFSSKFILNRQVFIADLGLVSPDVVTHSGPLVGSVSGRQPQQLPSNLHCVLRLRGGASSSSSGDEDIGHDGRVDSLLPDFRPRRVHPYEAAGSGFGDHRVLNDSRGGTARVVLAEAPAKEEGRRNRLFDHAAEQEALFRSILSRNRMQVPQPSGVEGPGDIVQVRLAPHVFGLGPGDPGFGSSELPSRIFPPLL